MSFRRCFHAIRPQLHRQSGIVPEPVKSARRPPTVARRLPVTAASRTTGWILAGMVGVASLIFASSPVHMDGEDVRTLRRGHDTIINAGPASQFSYSYNENSVNQSGDSGEYRHMRLQEISYLPGAHTGVYRYDTAQIASNDMPESEHAEAVLPYPAGYWGIFAVLDGRNGHYTSVWLRENIIYAAAGALVDLYSRLYGSSPSNSGPPSPSSDEIDQTLRDTFNRLDHDVVYGSVDRALSSSSHDTQINMLAPALSGSSAMLGFYDSNSRVLHVALTGDSRAVLGQRTLDKDGRIVYQVRVLSVEQDGSNLAEEYRLNARHPGEAVVYNGRVLGGGPTRSFGDAAYKWDGETHRRLRQANLGKSTPSDVKTPPYFTAEPEVTSTRVRPGDFLILGTRRMWEQHTSEEAVDLVAMWLDERWRQHGRRASENTTPAASSNDVLISPLIEDRIHGHQDRNAATHLLWNALSASPTTRPQASQASDASTEANSLTATVVFFADDQSIVD